MNRSPLSGAFSDGFRMIRLPAASAGATLTTTWLSGRLNGVMAATTPTGWRIDTASERRPPATTSRTSPPTRTAS